MPKPKYNVSQDKIANVRQAVKQFNNKIDYALQKGVSETMLPKKANADKIIRELGDKPAKLRVRMKQLRDFSAGGRVYKTKGGVRTTKILFEQKRKERNKSLRREREALRKASDLDYTARQYHERRIEWLKQNPEYSTAKQMRNLNFGIKEIEDIEGDKRVAVQNFKSAIAYAYANTEGELDMLYPRFNERLDRRLSKLSVDELNDLMANNDTVKALMEYYREKEGEVQYSGNSYFDLMWQFDEELPSIVKHYHYLRKKNGKK